VHKFLTKIDVPNATQYWIKIAVSPEALTDPSQRVPEKYFAQVYSGGEVDIDFSTHALFRTRNENEKTRKLYYILEVEGVGSSEVKGYEVEMRYKTITKVHPLKLKSCEGFIRSRGYSGRWQDGLHNGVDLAREPGCPIVAPYPGKVIYAGWRNGGFGYLTQIDHEDEYFTGYYHGSGEYYISLDQDIFSGDQLMFMGNSGNSHGTHLHITMFKDKPVEGNEVDIESQELLGPLGPDDELYELTKDI
jgi:murein DD-endopeptidase MepM/ murein hydrolase activator NlpD